MAVTVLALVALLVINVYHLLLESRASATARPCAVRRKVMVIGSKTGRSNLTSVGTKLHRATTPSM